jgi:hypothetical protein
LCRVVHSVSGLRTSSIIAPDSFTLVPLESRKC